MKKITFILLLMATTAASQAKFELTPDGFKAGEENFIVFDFSKNTAAQLFEKAKLHLTKLYKSYKDVASEVGDQMITINGYEPNAIRRTGAHVFDMSYNLVIRFKDGKVRVDAPTFKLTTFNSQHQQLHLVWTKFSLDGGHLGIYGKDNKLKSKKAKEDLEQFFNRLISGISGACNSSASDNW